MKPTVVLLGRPNVGKSTLFNRIVRARQALVDDTAGVTRDRHYGEAVWEGKEFAIIDTGGYLSIDDDYFAGQIKEQVKQAIQQSDYLVLILDGRAGLSLYDTDLVKILRKTDKPVFYVVNKIENLEHKKNLGDFYSLGIDNFYCLSAEHGIGVSNFLDDLVSKFPEQVFREQDVDIEKPIHVAIVGRPNVGKSSLANRLFGDNRMIVNSMPGTTRDAIEGNVSYKRRQFVLVDTAGIRRKGRVSEKIEKFSILKTLKSLDDCDVALIVVDCAENITEQDITIAGYAEKRGCGIIFLLNKWDIVDKREKNEKNFIKELRQAAGFLHYAPVMTVSAITGQHCHKIFDMVLKVYREYSFRLNTGTLNRIIEDAVYREQPSLHNGKRLRFFYSTQVTIRPPTFICFVNYPDAVHFSYHRYLINQLRRMIPLNLTPIRLYFREKTGRIYFSDNQSQKTQRQIRHTTNKIKGKSRKIIQKASRKQKNGKRK